MILIIAGIVVLLIVVFITRKILKPFNNITSVPKELAKGKPVQLIGFGTFDVSKRAARKGRNPQTGEEIKIAASKNVKFKAGKALKDLVNKR